MAINAQWLSSLTRMLGRGTVWYFPSQRPVPRNSCFPSIQLNSVAHRSQVTLYSWIEKRRPTRRNDPFAAEAWVPPGSHPPTAKYPRQEPWTPALISETPRLVSGQEIVVNQPHVSS